MTHSDDQGFVCPPAIAPEQVVVVPIWQEDNREEVLDYAEEVAEDLESAGIRVELDDRDERNPGFKFNEWELKGVPVRFEIGPNEVEDEEVTVVHRPDGESVTENRDDIAETTRDHFDAVFDKLYEAAEQNLEENVREAYEVPQILGTIGQHGGYVKTPWCGDEACETVVKDEIAAEIVMVPLDRDEEPIGEECSVCGDAAEETAYFAKSY
jgi:prolyl-tRNA synthetase